ncbi:MAG: hypothetical protein J6S71_00670 [Clostridia bacterium]|nr:hypothetical protein [Clostridia bacterium]
MKRTLRSIFASLSGILVFFVIVLLLGAAISVLTSVLSKIRILEVLLYSPIGSLCLPMPSFFSAFFGANYVIEKIEKDNYLPYLIVGIVLLVVYIPSGIITLLANSPSLADLFGIGAGVLFIKFAYDLKNQ